MNISIFLPCRKGSQRISNKNTRVFSGYKFGLTEIKIQQLLLVSNIDNIVVSTDDKLVIEYCEMLNSEKIIVHKRNPQLCENKTSTDDLVGHAADLIPTGHILWTHVTSPFFDVEHYNNIISLYFNLLQKGYDSLMTVSIIQSFIWSKDGPLNYDKKIEKWPRTQSLKPLYEVNSSAFISSVDNYRLMKDRIGNKPFLFEVNKIDGFDIDWPEDFSLAECLMGYFRDLKNN